jgi:hypothetical protein
MVVEVVQDIWAAAVAAMALPHVWAEAVVVLGSLALLLYMVVCTPVQRDTLLFFGIQIYLLQLDLGQHHNHMLMGA